MTIIALVSYFFRVIPAEFTNKTGSFPGINAINIAAEYEVCFLLF